MNHVFAVIQQSGEVWYEPHGPFEEDGDVCYHWWNKGRILDFWESSDGEISFLRCWGPHIHNEMEEGSDPTNEDILQLWQWLLIKHPHDLTKLYTFHDASDVFSYIRHFGRIKKVDIFKELAEAHPYLVKHFPDCEYVIEVFQDPETVGEFSLTIYIKTKSIVDDALHRLWTFDEDYGYVNTELFSFNLWAE